MPLENCYSHTLRYHGLILGSWHWNQTKGNTIVLPAYPPPLLFLECRVEVHTKHLANASYSSSVQYSSTTEARDPSGRTRDRGPQHDMSTGGPPWMQASHLDQSCFSLARLPEPKRLTEARTQLLPKPRYEESDLAAKKTVSCLLQ